MTPMPRTTILTCPHCHHQSEETMNVTTVERTLRCFHCDATITAPADAHCVWCAYADTPCYFTQNDASCNPVTLRVSSQ